MTHAQQRALLSIAMQLCSVYDHQGQPAYLDLLVLRARAVLAAVDEDERHARQGQADATN